MVTVEPLMEGGATITRESLARVFLAAGHGTLAPLTFLDLDHGLVERALARERQTKHSGPVAEGLLRDVGMVAAKIS